MEIYNEVQGGWPSQIISTMRRRVSAYTRAGIPFKIGITNDPYARASQYDYNEPYYDEMILIYGTSSINHVRELEAVLIDYYWDFCDNSIGGGGGRVGIGPYYLYIVR